MLKANNFLTTGLVCSVVLAVSAITGCRTATVPVEVTVPGEFNLSGVSKIAMVDFNSLPDDPIAGIYSADKETLSIVQRMVASVFCTGKMYQIADLDIEKSIASSHAGKTKVGNRFDAVIYGRLWWQVSPEYRNTYPKVFTLETWSNVKYDTGAKDPLTNKPIYATAHVTRNMRDVLETLYYRAWNANLMLSLTLYRLDKDGKFEKITETYAVASQNFILDNGKFETQFAPVGADNDDRASRLKASTEEKSTFGSLFSINKKAKDVSGKFVVIQNSATIPTELQAKLMLAGQLSSALGKKITPSKITFNIPCDFDDDKLFNLLKDGAFSAAKDYIVFTVRKNVGNKIADKIDPLTTYDMPKNLVPAEDPKKITDDVVNDAAKDQRDYIYALAVCEEATGQYEHALYTYRYAFKLKPTKEYALGISRCLFALGMNDRVQEKAKAQKSATKKANLK